MLQLADSSSDDNSCANKKHKKGKDNKSKSSRTTAQGTARYCELCKRAGMPYGKYSSHSTSQCKDAAEMKAKLSDGYKDQSPPSPTTAHAAPPRPPQPRHISPRVRKQVSPPVKTPHRLPRVGPNTKTIPSNRPTMLQFKSLDLS